MKAKELPPLEVLKELFYVKDGKLYWKVRRRGVRKGEAGCYHPDGYRRVGINSSYHLSHRIIYCLYHNVMITPDDYIDHINRDKSDNSQENLRIANHRENCYNRVRKNKHGVAGIAYVERNTNRPWRAVINIGGKQHHIGVYATKEEAIEARLQAEKEHGIYIYRE